MRGKDNEGEIDDGVEFVQNLLSFIKLAYRDPRLDCC